MLDFSQKVTTIRQMVNLGRVTTEDGDSLCKCRLSLRCRLTQDEATLFDAALGVAFEQHMRRQNRSEGGNDVTKLTVKKDFETTSYDFGEGARGIIVEKVCGQPNAKVADGHAELNWVIEITVSWATQGEIARMVDAEDTMLSIVDRQLPLFTLEEELEATGLTQNAMRSKYVDWTMKDLRAHGGEIGMQGHGKLTKEALITRIIQCEQHATSSPTAC